MYEIFLSTEKKMKKGYKKCISNEGAGDTYYTISNGLVCSSQRELVHVQNHENRRLKSKKVDVLQKMAQVDEG